MDVCLLVKIFWLPHSEFGHFEVVNRRGVASPSIEMPPKAKTFNFLNIVTQNAHGLKSDDRINEITTQVFENNIFAICLQETWRTGDDLFVEKNCTFILHGLDQNSVTCRLGKEGVGIVLSKAATDAWKLAGSKTYTDFGSRIIATRLLVKDNSNKDCFLYLVSAYAPIGVADQQIWDAFLTNLQKCIATKPNSDILLIGCNTTHLWAQAPKMYKCRNVLCWKFWSYPLQCCWYPLHNIS